MSQKSRDHKNRWRNKTVGFRVSPEEWDKIERLVRISGMSKQEYIMHRLQNTQMTIQANPRVFKALKNEIIALTEELKSLLASNCESKEVIEQVKILVGYMQMLG
ncbi:MAG TPA: hypothetical protein DCM73_04475 [Clostridiales bacterium]|nr:hypothetical protein [Clostridiales bacterium]